MPGPVVVTKLRVPSSPSMPLERLDGRLDDVWRHRLAVVVAPAGSGKTTLLARLAMRAPGPIGWYRAEGWDRDETALVSHIRAALAAPLGDAVQPWSSVEEVANGLEAWSGPPILLIVDDLHTLHGSAAEVALERLIDYAPDSLRVAIGSRVAPAFNLSRLRVSGALLELKSDDLRFRSWEVERLFRDFYAEPLPPEELATLARRTEGWAAGLQLFHLATRTKTADERRRLLAELHTTGRLTREYLARNVLDQLPTNLKRFLLETSVLGRLSGALCDRLRGVTGSAEILVELEARQLFTQSLAEDGVYRYHEVLRTYLLAALLDELGEDAVRARFSAAGELLVDAGFVSEALEAFCRGEDWEAARRLIDVGGELLAERPSAWLELLPAPLMLNDPWLLLASARRLRAEGRLHEAIDRYRRAELAFGPAEAADRCREERLAIANWLDEPLRLETDAFGLLRSALVRDPLAVAKSAQALPGVVGSLVAGLAALVGGHVASARRDLLHAAERSDASRPTVVVASLGAGVAGALMGQPHAVHEIEAAVGAAENAGLDSIARLGRAAIALTGTMDEVLVADEVGHVSAALGDQWTAAICALFAAWGALRSGRELGERSEPAPQFARLWAPVLEIWAQAISALAAVRAGDIDARSDLLSVASTARARGVDGAVLLAHIALAETATDPGEADDHFGLARALAHETGLDVGTEFHADPGPEAPPASDMGLTGGPAPLEIRLLGGFDLLLNGKPVELSGVRPRARVLLRLLALNAGRRMHHETIETALWPEADAAASARNLHVAMAALRRAIEPSAGRGSFQLLRRDGDSYVFTLPPGSEIDVARFEQLIASANQARLQGAQNRAAVLYQQALDIYRGELLPDDGPAEWVTERREAVRLSAVDATTALAEILLDRGEPGPAARTATAGLQIERFHDPLWRLLITARDQAGDHGAAHAARVGYDRMLADLGVAPGPIGGSSPL